MANNPNDPGSGTAPPVPSAWNGSAAPAPAGSKIGGLLVELAPLKAIIVFGAPVNANGGPSTRSTFSPWSGDTFPTPIQYVVKASTVKPLLTVKDQSRDWKPVISITPRSTREPPGWPALSANTRT